MAQERPADGGSNRSDLHLRVSTESLLQPLIIIVVLTATMYCFLRAEKTGPGLLTGPPHWALPMALEGRH